MVSYLSLRFQARFRSPATIEALTQKKNLRNARRVWAWLSGLIPDPGLDPWDELVAVCLLDRVPVPVRGP